VTPPPENDSASRLSTALAGRYAIERELGQGGMATVYLAEDLKHRRRVAIKVLRPELAAALGTDRFLHEIEIAARLQHPHILPMFDSGEAGGLLYYVMPYIEGESLRDRLRREQQLSLEDTVRIAREVALALAYSHARDVIHRDVKPENILLSGGSAIVADFGIARAVSAAGGSRLTSTGFSMGTPTYMSPEQSAGNASLDGRSDQYSLGCVTYEMLVGEPPFTGPSAVVVMARHSLDPVPSIRTVRGTVPPGCEAAIHRALAKTPADRFPRVEDFSEALVQAASGAAAGPGPAPRPRRSRRGWRRAADAAIAVLGIFALVLGARALMQRRAAALRTTPMIVVLPFDNLGRPEDGYLADGITDEITSLVAGLSGLGTIARASATQYSSAGFGGASGVPRSRAPAPDVHSKTVRQIGRELGVDYVLAGSVRTDRRPDGTGTVRVTPQLVRASDERVVWTEHYDAALIPGEIFRVQSDIAQRVAVAMNVALLLPEQVRLQQRPTDNLAAYEFFLRGNAYASHPYDREPERLAVAMYGRAVAEDPRFALAFARLAMAQSIASSLLDSAAVRRERARAALDRAFALDSTLVEVRIARGYYYLYAEHDHARALEELLVARRARPNDGALLELISTTQMELSRWDEAQATIERAVQLNPRSQMLIESQGDLYLYLRKYRQAEACLEQTRRLAPDRLQPYFTQSYLQLAWRGDIPGARKLIGQALQHADTSTVLASLSTFWPEHLAILDDPIQGALERATLSSLGVGAGRFYRLKADLYERLGRDDRVRAYSDSIRVLLEPRASAGAASWMVCSQLSFAYARLDRKADAIREARRAVDLMPLASNAVAHNMAAVRLAEVYILTGEHDAAVDQLRPLLERPSPISRAVLRVHPVYAPLRRSPRFQALIR